MTQIGLHSGDKAMEALQSVLALQTNVHTGCLRRPQIPNESSPISLPPFLQDMKDPLSRCMATPGGGSDGHRESSAWGQRGQ